MLALLPPLEKNPPVDRANNTSPFFLKKNPGSTGNNPFSIQITNSETSGRDPDTTLTTSDDEAVLFWGNDNCWEETVSDTGVMRFGGQSRGAGDDETGQ
jgi:hypothetical protein